MELGANSRKFVEIIRRAKTITITFLGVVRKIYNNIQKEYLDT